MPKNSRKAQRQDEHGEVGRDRLRKQKENRNSRTGEDRDRDVGCSIIHGSIKDAQALGLSTGFWPLYRRNSSAPILTPAADPVSDPVSGS